jgi:hypothetical protein
MPLTICKYCYFKVKDTTIDKEQVKTTEKLPSIEKWRKTLLHMHVGQKNWVWLMLLIWLLPIVLIIISFFTNFSYLAIISLVVFFASLVGNYLHMVRIKCPSCAIREECHSSF